MFPMTDPSILYDTHLVHSLFVSLSLWNANGLRTSVVHDVLSHVLNTHVLLVTGLNFTYMVRKYLVLLVEDLAVLLLLSLLPVLSMSPNFLLIIRTLCHLRLPP